MFDKTDFQELLEGFQDEQRLAPRRHEEICNTRFELCSTCIHNTILREIERRNKGQRRAV
jgi:hypothetical protein